MEKNFEKDKNFDYVRDVMFSNCESEDEYQEAYGDFMNSFDDD